MEFREGLFAAPVVGKEAKKQMMGRNSERETQKYGFKEFVWYPRQPIDGCEETQ